MPAAASIEEVDRLSGEFPDLPIEAILKEDLLRQGIAFSDAALRASADTKPKSYFIFSFDRRPIEDMELGESSRAPEEIALSGGPRGLRRTIVSVRIAPDSPYVVDHRDGALVLTAAGEILAEVGLQEMPSYYRRTLANGKPINPMQLLARQPTR